VVEEDDVVVDSREVQSQRVTMVVLVERVEALTVVTEVEAVVEVETVKVRESRKLICCIILYEKFV
jgi:hypothetical protein